MTKTKVTISGRKENLRLNIALRGETLQNVNEFTYFGSKITKDGRRERHIIGRINQADCF